MKSAESAIRISGTLRRKVDESIEKKIVSKVLILLLINYCYYQIYYKTNTESGVKLYLDFIKEYVIIWERHETDSVKDNIKLIKEVVKSNYEKSKKHLISYKQFIDINNMMCNVDYSYQENFIKTILFKMVGRIDKGALSKNDLKMYILENEKIEFILEEIGCKKIRYISNTKGDDYYKCTNPDGNNPEAIRVYLNEYLNVTDYTRNLGDVADIYTLVQYSKKYSFSQTLVYLNQLLGLTKLSETELRMLSIQTDNKKTEIKREARTKKEMKRQEEQRKYQIALAKDKCLYDAAEPILYLDWVKEGIIEVTRREFGIKYFEYDGKHKQIIFPIKNYKTGEVVAYQKRMLYNEDYSTSYEAIGLPKYMITEGYDKNDNVYGLWENIDGIRKKKLIVIYESPKSVMKRWTLRDFTGVAIQGHFLSYKQAEIIAQTIGESYERAYWEQESCELTGETPKNIKYEKGEVVVAFDKDVPLNDILAACWRLKDTLQSAGFKISYIYDKWYKLDNKESPADANKATFDYLMENRIVYKE